MSDVKFGPDPIRERDLGTRLGIDVAVKTSSGGSRRAMLELNTDDLDRLTGAVDSDYLHYRCVSETDHEAELDEAKEIGRQEGYAQALADIEVLGEGSA